MAGALVHELLHNCGAGDDEKSPHRRADVGRVYCMGPGNEEVDAKLTVDFEKNINLLLTYRHLLHEWSSGKLQLRAGADIGLTGLFRLADRTTPAELGSGMLGIKRRFNAWGAERYGGLSLTADVGAGADTFKVRAATANETPKTAVGPGVVLQIGTRIEFWIPDIQMREGRVSALSFEAGYRLVQPLTPDAQRIHEVVLGIGGAF